MLPEQLVHSFGLIKLGIIILEQRYGIIEETIPWWNNLGIQYIQVVRWPLNVASLFALMCPSLWKKVDDMKFFHSSRVDQYLYVLLQIEAFFSS